MVVFLFAKSFVETTRLKVRSDCDDEFRVELDAGACNPLDCDEDFELDSFEFNTEEFVWHPSRKF